MKIVVYSKENCPWCDKLKNFLEEKNLTYIELRYNVDYSKEDLRALLEGREKITVPQVFVNGENKGGYEDFIRWMTADKWRISHSIYGSL